MATNIKELINQCEQELTSREYTFNRHKVISMTWVALVQWMTEREYENFDEDIGYRYCDETFGAHVLFGIKKNDRIRLRAIRMLISYQKDGDFEFRTPSILRTFVGASGEYMEIYLQHLREIVHLTENTISNKRHYLHAFNSFMEEHHIVLNDLKLDSITDFYACQLCFD